MSTAVLAAPYKTDRQAGAENQGALPSVPPSVLQVTGTTNNFTISAQHADVLSLLKLVFDQSHRQFVPDASVTGDVTFALSGQRFDTVLDAICRQTFLRYEVDKQGIYRFRRDDEALRNLLLKTQAVNNFLSEQLRRMGYAVPSALLGANGQTSNRAMPGTQQAPGAALNGGPGASGGGFGGGFGRSNTNSAAGRARGDGASNGPAPSSVLDASGVSRRSADGGQAAQAGVDAKMEAARKSGNRGGLEESQRPLGANGQGGEPGPSGPAGQGIGQGTRAQAVPGSQAGQFNARDSAFPEIDLDDSGQYQTFKKQNSFVSVNTRGEKLPVQQVLADLSRQAGVPILVDPDVPKGEEFVISGSIPALPLKEMLNFLGYRARLEWRWVNGRIYVTTTPELQIYLRGAMLPAPGNGTVGGGITILPQRLAAPAGQSAPRKAESEKEADKAKDAEKAKEGDKTKKTKDN